jgi:hypothetical protein
MSRERRDDEDRDDHEDRDDAARRDADVWPAPSVPVVPVGPVRQVWPEELDSPSGRSDDTVPDSDATA